MAHRGGPGRRARRGGAHRHRAAASWVPRHRADLWGLVAGLLATAAVVCFLLATQTGLLTIAAVVTSLYPAFTVLLAATVLRERIHGTQGLGLACCGLAVALVAAG